MSRSNNTDIKNPSAKFFQWSGDEGRIKWYDKETKENVFVDLPFTFLVLDRLTTITGYSDEDNCGFWSNEIRNLKTQPLTVRTRNGIKKIGLYEQVKAITGVKFAQSVYIAFFDGPDLKIGNFKFTGCAVSAWIEFGKKHDIYKGAIKIVGSEEGRKGKTVYYSPTFEIQEAIKPQTEEAAVGLDKDLQKYLAAYFERQGETAPVTGQEYIEARNAEIAEFSGNESANPNDWNGDGTTALPDDDIPF